MHMLVNDLKDRQYSVRTMIFQNLTGNPDFDEWIADTTRRFCEKEGYLVVANIVVGNGEFGIDRMIEMSMIGMAFEENIEELVVFGTPFLGEHPDEIVHLLRTLRKYGIMVRAVQDDCMDVYYDMVNGLVEDECREKGFYDGTAVICPWLDNSTDVDKE